MNHYIANKGYSGLQKVLKIKPENVIEEIKKSGLRGRGGAGFPTWRKWQFCSDAVGSQKYLICNADEGDPGAFMNRSLLEGDPHSLLEGMLIAGYAIGASIGYIYCRAEYPLALIRLRAAIKQAEEKNLLGDNILGSGFDFHIKIKEGAGAFVCGEETALIASIEGNRGMPRSRPPFPAIAGLWQKPTIINNVETLASVARIMQNNAEWFSKYGTENSKGTKTFALVGKVKNTGLIEVPLGISLREIIFDIGGGVPNGKKFKAVQTGGPSGGCIPANLLDIKVDYDSLAQAGTIMGSGGLVVMDEDTCMVDVARYFLDFAQKESCGECAPCRLGTKQMLEILNDITSGKGTMDDIELLESLGYGIKKASLCGLGQTAANPVLTTLKYFRNEYEEHIKNKKCKAVVCKEIVSSPCQFTCPINTEASVYIALIALGKYEEALRIVKKDNPFASSLSRVCNHPCELKCRAGQDGGQSIAIRDLKRFATDYGLKNDLYSEVTPSKKTKGIKVAIIGSGPAGLTCGFYLSQKGYDVTVFEKESVIGGMLALGVPEYRLPREILDADVNYILSAGIEVKTNAALGKDFTIEQLFNQNYKAIFIATGAYKSLKINIPNEDIIGVIPGIEFLKKIRLGKKVQIGKKVAIIGGGNSAIDVARTVLRLGKSESVTIYYRRTIDEMPAHKEEVEGALEEGIKFETLTVPIKLIPKDGKLNSCEFIRVKMGDIDESGRKKLIQIEGSEFTVKLDTLIISISESPDTSFLKNEKIERTKWNTIKINSETFETTQKGVFAGGDVVTGPNTVVDAVASGKIAAESINQYLNGEEIKREYKLTRPSIYVEPTILTPEEIEELSVVKRYKPMQLSAKNRKTNFNEVEFALSEEDAVKEAKRCLRCELGTEEGKQFINLH